MKDIVIKAEGLGKKYTIGHEEQNERYLALRDMLMKNARSFWHKTKDMIQGKPIIQGDTLEEVWALKEASFEIQRGEAIGVIGRNGAGKSTLLKVLSRITEPSAGRVTIKGRVASLLEVGTGFHPELTGRENIYLNGAILGMTRAEMKRKFDEIVDFAEVEKFLDTPVKRFSSGMYVRLAFSVAAHLEPEILLVDEVLAVGDMKFQKKCLGKMQDVSSNEGRTVVFVSHNMGTIATLCQRTMLIENGQIKFFGRTPDALNIYADEIGNFGDTFKGNYGNEYARLYEAKAESKGESDYFFSDAPIEIRLTYEVLKPLKDFVLGFSLISEFGTHLAYVLHDDYIQFPEEVTKPGLYTKRFIIPQNTLAKGMYHIKVDMGLHNFKTIYSGNIVSFSVLNRNNIGCRFDVGNHPRLTSQFRPDWAVK
ncbi:MAG: ABC transporter ATP-binding protein [Syntrophaceae bacterium]|nr:ABC transporter ATP-binding protein [Syntrophaceae bacterium]